MDARQDFWSYGVYDQVSQSFLPIWNFTLLDYGKTIYASKSFYDSNKNRRIYLSWISEADSNGHPSFFFIILLFFLIFPLLIAVSRGWAGVESIPKQVTIDEKRKRLSLNPIKELELLRESNAFQISNFTFPPSTQGTNKMLSISGKQLEIRANFSVPSCNFSFILFSFFKFLFEKIF